MVHVKVGKSTMSIKLMVTLEEKDLTLPCPPLQDSLRKGEYAHLFFPSLPFNVCFMY